MKYLKKFDEINESKRADEVLSELEADMTEYALGAPIESMRDHVSGLLWNLFISKKYRYRLNDDDIKEIINTLIDKVIESENESDDTKLDSRITEDNIKNLLVKKLEKSIHGKVGQTETRARQLMEIHKKFIENMKDKMTPEEIAERLFEYDKNLSK